MAAKSCRVTITDMENVDHTVHVSAATLYEAVALGLKALRGNDWVGGIGGGLNTVQVQVSDVSVEHRVKMGDFTKWLERKGGSPKQVVDRNRVRDILGLYPHA
jgi:hypothetical protein